MYNSFFQHCFHFAVYFLLISLCFSIYRAGLFRPLSKCGRKVTVFLLTILILAASAALKTDAFTPLVYFDEHNYILGAQNIIEANTNALCETRIEGKCIRWIQPPHGFGMSAIYGLVYNYNFDLLYRNAACLNLLFYLANGLLIFFLAMRIYGNVYVSCLAAALNLFLPYNIIYATNVLPFTFVHTLLLISALSFTEILNTAGEDKTKAEYQFRHLALISALVLMASVRIEYAALYGAYLFYVFVIEKPFAYLKEGGKFAGYVILPVLSALICAQVLGVGLSKINGMAGSNLSFSNINFSYIQHYFNSFSLALITGFVLIYGIYAFMKSRRGKMPRGHTVMYVMSSVFCFYVALYSFYNFQGNYRFLIPVNFIYCLIAAKGIFEAANYILKNGRHSTVSIIIGSAVLCYGLTDDASRFKGGMISIDKQTVNNSGFLDIFRNDNLIKPEGVENDGSLYFIQAAYLGQMFRLKNYADSPFFEALGRKFGNSKTLYFIDSPFLKLEDSAFAASDEFVHSPVFRQDAYSVYKIRLK